MQQHSEIDESQPTKEKSSESEAEQSIQDQEWPQNNKIDLFDLANAAGQLVGNGENKPAALEDFFNKLKHLETAWYEAEMKYNNLRSINERLTNQLVHSRAKCAIYQKKLRFIQDNQKNFAKLKEVYMTMKCEEGGVRGLVDLKDRCCQTNPLIVTINPLTTTGESINGCLVPVKQDSLVSLRRSEIGEAQQNLQILKEMIVNRERSWTISKRVEEELRSELRALQTQKATLEEIIGIKDNEIETLKSIQQKPSVREEIFDDLLKIIFKMDKRMKDLEKSGKIGRYIVIFSDQERNLLQDILDNRAFQRPSIEPRKEFRIKEMPKRLAASAKSSPINVTKKVHQTMSSVPDKTPVKVTQPPPKKTFFEEATELEALQKIRKEIEEKQSALREKVQQIIDYSGGKGGSAISGLI